MSQLPFVSIVGRPNVGKSSLFNRIIKKRVAVVDDLPGVTRDRNYYDASWDAVDFTVVDTGGFLPVCHDSIEEEINRQVKIAIDESSVIVFIVDATVLPTDYDLMIARNLKRYSSDKTILVANKCESADAELNVSQYSALGPWEPIALSAIHGSGVSTLLDGVLNILSDEGIPKPLAVEIEDDLKIALAGRPNVGKSTFLNSIMRQDRVIVTDIPGTTRDPIDIVVKYEKSVIRLIDTAGLRRKSQIHDKTEYYTNLRALSSIERCDVCLLFVDVDEGVCEQELKILKKIDETRKGCVVCLNKWDLVDKDHDTYDRFISELKKKYKEFRFAVFISISALKRQRIYKTLNYALKVKKSMTRKIETAKLKKNFAVWTHRHPHPFNKGKKVNILGCRQRKASYPYFEIFCNYPKLVLPSYRNYLQNKIYELGEYYGVPVALSFRLAGKREKTVDKI